VSAKCGGATAGDADGAVGAGAAEGDEEGKEVWAEVGAAAAGFPVTDTGPAGLAAESCAGAFPSSEVSRKTKAGTADGTHRNAEADSKAEWMKADLRGWNEGIVMVSISYQFAAAQSRF